MVVQCYSLSLDPSLSLFSCVSACLCDILLCTATLKSLPVDAGCVSCGLCSIANEAREVPCKVYGDGFARRACQLSKVLCSHISWTPWRKGARRFSWLEATALRTFWWSFSAFCWRDIGPYVCALEEDLSLSELFCAAGSLAWINSSKVQNQFMVWMRFRPTTGRNHSHACGRLAVPIQ